MLPDRACGLCGLVHPTARRFDVARCKWFYLPVLAITFMLPSLIGAGTASAASGAKLGVNVDCAGLGSNANTVINEMAAAHAGYVRIGVSWAALEPSNPAVVGYGNSFNLSYMSVLGGCFAAVHNAGMNVLAVMDETPAWANGGQGNNVPPTNPQDYANAAETLTSNFVASNATNGINEFEVWNEADSSTFWTGSIAQYVTMLEDTYNSVRIYSTASIILAGTKHIDEAWDAGVYSAGGGPYFTGLGIHPYPRIATNTNMSQIFNGSADYPNTLGNIAALDTNYGYPNRQIWLTEEGWSSDPSSGLGLTGQANALTSFYNYIRGSCSGCSKVKVGMWYPALLTSGTFAPYSLLYGDLSGKPSYNAYAALP